VTLDRLAKQAQFIHGEASCDVVDRRADRRHVDQPNCGASSARGHYHNPRRVTKYDRPMGALSAASWQSTVARHFRFLEEDFHMSVIATDDSTNFETSITYASDPSAVIVRYSVEFDRAEVELIRLIDGKVPRVPIFVHPDTPIDRALLSDLLLLRAPSDSDELKRRGGLGKDAVERSLSFQALALRQHASDFLKGDTEVFKDFDRLIKDRVAGNPQKLTISFPEGTPRNEVEQGVAQALKVDPQVPVEAHFYGRPAARRQPGGGLGRGDRAASLKERPSREA
jgi:hypothetical protein